jgi:hypothetical protein
MVETRVMRHIAPDLLLDIYLGPQAARQVFP